MTKITERDIESLIDMQLAAQGWQTNPRQKNRNVFHQRPQTDEERSKLGRFSPDFVLYADNDSGQATMVIEAKKPSKQNKTLAQALEQGKKYAKLLKAPIVIATDGYILKSWHMELNAPLFFNSGEVDELFSPTLATYFANNNIYESFSKRERLSKRDLISKFSKANDILRAEGMDAGIVRFSEFANLMFLKLLFENSGGGGSPAGLTWEDIERKRGQAQLNAVKSALAQLRREHSRLFEQTRIKSPVKMERLVEILSSFELSGIRDDIKGMAFEYFIHSYTQGFRGDLGQYFTPRHIIKMMVDYLRPQLGETVYDPFCGTGGMLIECFRYIQQHGVSDQRALNRLHKQTIYGRDNNSVARIAMMNMIMFGDGHSNIKHGDSYQHCGGQKYDVVITNIPFSQHTDFVEGYPLRPALSEQNGDSIGVQHCLMSLKDKPDARAAIVVPIGFIYKGELAAEREYIVRNFHLERVVELTPKCFNPYTEQQTAVLMLRRRKQPRGKPLYYHVRNDGFTQNGYRVPVAGENDIDKVMDSIGGITLEIGEETDWRYKSIVPLLRRGEKRLGELAEVRKGNAISPSTMLHYTIGGRHPIMMVKDLAAAHIDYYLDGSEENINDLALKERRPHLFPQNAIVIPTSGKAALKNHRALLATPAYLSSTLTGIIAKQAVHPYYLFYWLLHWDAEAGTYDLGYPGVLPSILREIAIPWLPLHEQNTIVAKIADLVKLHSKLKHEHKCVVDSGINGG